ncbi:hypothetical protein LWI29_013953 [Acer saccharum]|uniref:RNase H type-1 domain-containing protein n=1 Tax=Acer saccharum TaxID=4024 RepID=A0AA39RJW1_ACESA|nr:hypothetical protein LWI29_013953 [Acer saccharum]
MAYRSAHGGADHPPPPELLRKVAVQDCCPLCQKLGESTLHALWECEKIKKARKSWFPGSFPVHGKFCDFFDLILFCFSSLSLEDLELFCIILWRIWFLRNSSIHGAPLDGFDNVLEWASDFLVDFKGCRSVCLRSSPPCLSVCWFLPPSGVYKINCDAALDGAGRKVGFSIVIRDGSGSVLACSSQVVTASFSALVAETMAIGRAIIFSRDCGMFPCILESDVAVVVNWILEGSHLNSVVGPLLEDIAGLRNLCGGLCVQFAPRSANKVAHVLAKQALKNVEDFFWLEEFPLCAAHVIQADMPD